MAKKGKKRRVAGKKLRRVVTVPGGPVAPLSFRREELLVRLHEAVSRATVAYVVGGADAMDVHGYRRQTRDVDVFVTEAGRNRLMSALRAAGLETFVIDDPSHYAAKLPGDPDPERRIDVLVPAGEPELSAIDHSVVGEIEGMTFRVVRPTLLAVMKFNAWCDRQDPKDANDILAMYRRGVFDVDAVREMIALLDPDDVPRFNALLAPPERLTNPHWRQRVWRAPPPASFWEDV